MKAMRTVLVGAAVMLGACTTRTDYLLPAGFSGPAMILFDDPLGGDVTKVGRRHESYQFGLDGVLRLRTPFPDRGEVSHFYFVDPAGNRTEIPQTDGDRVQILSILASAAPRQPPSGSFDGFKSTTEGGFGILAFIVGRRRDYPDPIGVLGELRGRVLREEYHRLATRPH